MPDKAIASLNRDLNEGGPLPLRRRRNQSLIVDKARIAYRGPEATLVLCWGLKRLGSTSFRNGEGLVPFPEMGGIPAYAFDSFEAPDTGGEIVTFNAEPLSAVLDLSGLDFLFTGQQYGTYVWVTKDQPSCSESTILEGLSGGPLIVVEEAVLEVIG